VADSVASDARRIFSPYLNPFYLCLVSFLIFF
jgi:hypothetical protein